MTAGRLVAAAGSEQPQPEAVGKQPAAACSVQPPLPVSLFLRLDNGRLPIRISSVAKRSSAAQRRVTTHDVAARAGVSQPTVSLVLSRNPTARVAADTRQRVLKAAEELGYQPNVVARSLVRRRSYAIGLVVPDLANQFFAHVVSGAQRVAVEEGYAVLLCEQSTTGIDQHLEALRARQVDGLILDAAGASAIPEE